MLQWFMSSFHEFVNNNQWLLTGTSYCHLRLIVTAFNTFSLKCIVKVNYNNSMRSGDLSLQNHFLLKCGFECLLF